MWDEVHQIMVTIYFTMLVLLSLYGAHRLWMLFLYYRHRHDRPEPPARFEQVPVVTVQLPVYNEPCVVERLLDAVARLDYPRDRLEIQVLDDSTDETPRLVAAKVLQLRADGWNIHHLRRPHRQGFKAGALQFGLERARGEIMAIFDADFVPPPDLLRRTVDYFTDPKVGMVQLRWGHLNDQQSLLTRVQSILIDGHFLIEQTARSRSGRFFNFNGTAGLWRRQCIEDAGGWSADTLAEDLDLSYRAQLRGWRFVFLPDVVVPAELPVEMTAFKTQQHRWAKGTIQTCKKLLPSVWRSSLPLKIKLEATIHLTSNFGYVMLVVLCLLCRAPAAANAVHLAGGHWWMKLLFVDMPLFFAATVSVVAFYIFAQRELHVRWWERLAYVPLMMAVGVGLSLNNARGVLEAVFNHRSEFVRTPKYGLKPRAQQMYRRWRGLLPWVELAMAGYFAYVLADVVDRGQWMMAPFVLIMVTGFAYVGLSSLIPPRLEKSPGTPWAPAGA